jgi:hypothetical protein
MPWESRFSPPEHIELRARASSLVALLSPNAPDTKAAEAANENELALKPLGLAPAGR